MTRSMASGGDDYMNGGAGVDYFDGGDGDDRVSFYNRSATQGAVAKPHHPNHLQRRLRQR